PSRWHQTRSPGRCRRMMKSSSRSIRSRAISASLGEVDRQSSASRALQTANQGVRRREHRSLLPLTLLAVLFREFIHRVAKSDQVAVRGDLALRHEFEGGGLLPTVEVRSEPLGHGHDHRCARSLRIVRLRGGFLRLRPLRPLHRLLRARRLLPLRRGLLLLLLFGGGVLDVHDHPPEFAPSYQDEHRLGGWEPGSIANLAAIVVSYRLVLPLVVVKLLEPNDI